MDAELIAKIVKYGGIAITELPKLFQQWLSEDNDAADRLSRWIDQRNEFLDARADWDRTEPRG